MFLEYLTFSIILYNIYNIRLKNFVHISWQWGFRSKKRPKIVVNTTLDHEVTPSKSVAFKDTIVYINIYVNDGNPSSSAF